MRRAWFGGSKDGIEKIVSRGFGHSEIMESNSSDNVNGVRIIAEFLVESLESSLPDEDGVRHVLLCRVLLGKLKVVRSGLKQIASSFEDFDTGVDDLQHHRRYIIRSTNMNIHILPEYIISFKAPSVLQGLRFNVAKDAFKRPTSPWMAFPSLIIQLSKFLPYDSIKTICKDYKNYKDMRSSRAQFVGYIRNVAGDKLLAAILRSRIQRNFKDERRRLVHHDLRKKNNLRRASVLEGQQQVIRWLCHTKDLDDLQKKNLANELIRLLM